MTIEQLRNVYNAQSFRPFVIHLANGREVPVHHREFIMINVPFLFAIITRSVMATFSQLVFRRETVMRGTAFACIELSRIIGAALALAALPGLRVAAAEPPLEKRILLGPETAPQWSAAESTVKTSTAHVRSGSSVLHWHITVDHFAGEPQYPIGWPRANCSLREAAARDWSEWDYFQFWVYTDSTRAVLPREPVGLTLYTPEKPDVYNRPLTELKKGEWVHVRMPVSQIPHHQDVRGMQFHISESQYRHQDQLDLYVDEIALARYAEPMLLDFAPEAAVMFADEKQLALRFNLAGIKSGDRVEVVCELRKGGAAVARTVVEAERGPQRMTIDLSRAKPEAGDYDVVASGKGGAVAAARVRLVDSPWK